MIAGKLQELYAGMSTNQNAGQVTMAWADWSEIARQSVDVLLPARLWSSETRIADILDVRLECPDEVSVRVLLGVTADMTVEAQVGGGAVTATRVIVPREQVGGVGS